MSRKEPKRVEKNAVETKAVEREDVDTVNGVARVKVMIVLTVMTTKKAKPHVTMKNLMMHKKSV